FAVTGPPGMTIDSFGRIEWETSLADRGDHPIVVSVTDPYGASDVRLYNLAVVRDNIPPRLDLACPAGPATVGTMLDVSLRATDDSGRVIFDVTVAGVPVAMSASGPGVFTGTTQLTQLGNNEILVVARDRAGNVTTNRCSIFVG